MIVLSSVASARRAMPFERFLWAAVRGFLPAPSSVWGSADAVASPLGVGSAWGSGFASVDEVAVGSGWAASLAGSVGPFGPAHATAVASSTARISLGARPRVIANLSGLDRILARSRHV